jgi:potassium/chloride transporter 9
VSAGFGLQGVSLHAIDTPSNFSDAFLSPNTRQQSKRRSSQPPSIEMSVPLNEGVNSVSEDHIAIPDDSVSVSSPAEVLANPVRNDDSSVGSVSSTIDVEGTGETQARPAGNSSFFLNTDRTPLLRQIRLFQSLSGANTGNGNGMVSPPDAVRLDPSLTATGSVYNSLRTLNTFSGVFTPVCLSMFSAILFLRVGYILGHSGLLVTLFELCLAYIILVFTVLSICAISTNGAIEGGGAYFMISRALGPEFGGSIGTLFFIANIFSSALYLTGCVEGIISNFGAEGSISHSLSSGVWYSFLYGTALNFLNMVICLIGATLFAKTSAIIFFTVMTACFTVICSLLFQQPMMIEVPEENTLLNVTQVPFTSFSVETFKGNLLPNWGIDYTTNTMTSFPLVFGVMFSGVTGIMAGANMSGELKDPGKSIPKGTLGAVAFTFTTYLLLFFMTASTCPSHLLKNVNLYMQPINLWPPFVAIGLFAATLSAALSNLIGASRVLEALVKDKLFGVALNWINNFSIHGNPVGAVIVSVLLVQFVLLIGSLNRIAQITSTFFLLSYFSTNLACLALTLTSAPNFRPGFKYFSATTCGVGMFGCLAMMFMINPLYALYVITSCLILVIVLHLRSPPVRWGSISQALIFHQVRKYLLLLDSRKDHVKYWRPQFLLMVSNPRTCLPLVTFANDLKKSGLYILGHVKLGSLNDVKGVDPVIEEYPLWLKLIDKIKVKAFVELTLASSVREGLHHLARMGGLGAMKPNTVLFGFYDDAPPEDFFDKDMTFNNMRDERIESTGEVFCPVRDTERRVTREEYVNMIYDCIFKLQKNVCLARHFHTLQKVSFIIFLGGISEQLTECLLAQDQVILSGEKNYIDIWPLNFFNPANNNIDNCWLFLMQLACILHMVPGWKKSTSVRVFMCIDGRTKDAAMIHRNWQQTLIQLRIEAKIHVVIWDNPLSPTSEVKSVDNSFTGSEDPEVTFGMSSDWAQSSGFEESFRSTTSTERRNQPFDPLDVNFLKNVNSMISEHSNNTAVIFLYLPTPPSKSKSEKKQYLEKLDILTASLPPTLLVHGISPVTSTTL